jgi:hypothetical protein
MSFSQPNCKGLLGGTRGTSEQILSYASRVIDTIKQPSVRFCSSEGYESVPFNVMEQI